MPSNSLPEPNAMGWWRALIMIICVVAFALHAQAASLYVHVVTTNQFAAELIYQFADDFSRQSGTQMFIRQTTSPDDTVIRAVALKEPIDVIVLPYITYRQYMARGWLTELHDYLPEQMTHSPATQQRWLWGSIKGRVQCGYIPGSINRSTLGEPSYMPASGKQAMQRRWLQISSPISYYMQPPSMHIRFLC